jgi:hypothetical protein
MVKSYICLGQTPKLAIDMEDFYSHTKLYLNDYKIKTIVDAGSLDGGDAII